LWTERRGKISKRFVVVDNRSYALAFVSLPPRHGAFWEMFLKQPFTKAVFLFQYIYGLAIAALSSGLT
jgi:hypothetical protein